MAQKNMWLAVASHVAQTEKVYIYNLTIMKSLYQTGIEAEDKSREQVQFKLYKGYLTKSFLIGLTHFSQRFMTIIILRQISLIIQNFCLS